MRKENVCQEIRLYDGIINILITEKKQGGIKVKELSVFLVCIYPPSSMLLLTLDSIIAEFYSIALGQNHSRTLFSFSVSF